MKCTLNHLFVALLFVQFTTDISQPIGIRNGLQINTWTGGEKILNTPSSEVVLR